MYTPGRPSWYNCYYHISNNLRGVWTAQQSHPLLPPAMLKTNCLGSGGHHTIHSASIRLHKQAWLRGVLDVGVHILSVKGTIA